MSPFGIIGVVTRYITSLQSFQPEPSKKWPDCTSSPMPEHMKRNTGALARYVAIAHANIAILEVHGGLPN